MICAVNGCGFKTKNISAELCCWHSKLEYQPSGCIIFTGAPATGGYGMFHRPGTNEPVLAHRYAWELAGLPEPEAGWFHPFKNPSGWVVDHDDSEIGCGNPKCVNPAHLKVTTQKRNTENKRPRPQGSRHSQYRGVTWNRRAGKWVVQVGHNRKLYHPSSEIPGWEKRPTYYVDEHEAGAMAEKLRGHLFGGERA